MNTNLEKKLNEFLANQQVMYTRLHNMHWYIKGSGFFTVHAKLEELYDRCAEIIDEVAERMLALDMKPVANLKVALEITKVKEREDMPISTEDVIRALVVDTQYWINDCKELAKLADEAGDAVTADIFVGYLGEYEKLLWMFKSYMA